MDEATKKLHEDLSRYHLMDARWQMNYITRCRWWAKKIDPKANKPEEEASLMRLDIIGLRTGRNITFKEHHV